MSTPRRRVYPPWRSELIERVLDSDGTPLCDPPDGCTTCVLVTHPMSGEDRMSFARRIVAQHDAVLAVRQRAWGEPGEGY